MPHHADEKNKFLQDKKDKLWVEDKEIKGPNTHSYVYYKCFKCFEFEIVYISVFHLVHQVLSCLNQVS